MFNIIDVLYHCLISDALCIININSQIKSGSYNMRYALGIHTLFVIMYSIISLVFQSIFFVELACLL